MRRCRVQYSTEFKTLSGWTIFLRQHYTYSYHIFTPPPKKRNFSIYYMHFYNYCIRSSFKVFYDKNKILYARAYICLYSFGYRLKMRDVFITIMSWFQHADQILPKLLAPHKRWSRWSLENDSLLHWNAHTYNCNRFITWIRLNYKIINSLYVYQRADLLDTQCEVPNIWRLKILVSIWYK